MLTIYLEEDEIKDKDKIVRDVEQQFKSMKFRKTDVNAELLRKIDDGHFTDKEASHDDYYFRWHEISPISELSTGFKAAYCVANLPDKIIDTIECRLPVRDAIVNICTSGSILFHNDDVTICEDEDHPTIDVRIGDYRFTTVSRLNRYIKDEYPLEPDFGWEGIEYVQSK